MKNFPVSQHIICCICDAYIDVALARACSRVKVHVFSLKQYKEHEKYFFQYDIFDAHTGAGILSGKADADPRVITSAAIAYKEW